MRFTCLAAALVMAAPTSLHATPRSELIEIEADRLAEYWVPEKTSVSGTHEPARRRSGAALPQAREVVLRFVIDARGRIRDVEVVSSSPPHADHRWAVTMLKLTSYVPAESNTRRSAVRLVSTMTLRAPSTDP
ncbi:energy transducer TonB [Dokdonella sp. MW10]|uniref:energy transducer TonB n=1 Tax=Dokdonella sp. MW10 TaxID=2992926 RepID=UPI003F8203AB